jgi:hypothetical protein
MELGIKREWGGGKRKRDGVGNKERVGRRGEKKERLSCL